MASAEIIRLEVPSPPEIVATCSPLVADARAFVIADKDGHGLALERIAQLRSAERAIEEHFEPAKKAAHQAHKAITAAVAKLTGPIADARREYDKKAAAHEALERKKAEDEARRLRELARAQEEERALLDAIAAEGAGNTAQAEAILAEPVSVPTVSVQPALAEVAGLVMQTRWSAEVEDLLALVKYVAVHPEWLMFLQPNMPALNRLAVSQRGTLSIPGVKAVSTTVRVARGS